MISVSSCSVSSPIRLARTSTDGWPSKCGVVKNGDDSSWTSACLSDSDGTQNTITSGYRSPVSGSVASGRGVRKNTNDLPPTWYTGLPCFPCSTVTCGMPMASSCTSPIRARRVLAAMAGPLPGGQSHRQPPRSPGPRRTVEHAGQPGAAVQAPAVAGEPPGTQPVPVAFDHQRAASVAARALALGVVDVAGVGVSDAVVHCDAPGPA